MLSNLLTLLEQNHGEVDLRQLSRQLGTDPNTLAGMLTLLVEMGKLVEVGPGCGYCESCSLRPQCGADVRRGRRFHLRRTPPPVRPS